MRKKPKRENLKPQRFCIFCGGGGLSREHVWPQWSAPYIPKRPNPSHKTSVFTSSPADPDSYQLKKTRQYQGDLRNMMIRVVCEGCNNGWMSELEDRSKKLLLPLILGEAGVFSKDGQKTIATWIAMKVMVAEFSNPIDVSSSFEDRAKLKKLLSPPDNGWRIWILPNDGGNWTTGYLRSSLTMATRSDGEIPRPPNGSYSKNTQSVTLGIGQVVFYVLATSVPGTYFQLPADMINHMRQIWPFEGNFLWPTGSRFSDTVVDQLSLWLDRSTKNMNWASGPFDAE